MPQRRVLLPLLSLLAWGQAQPAEMGRPSVGYQYSVDFVSPEQTSILLEVRPERSLSGA